MPPQARWEAEGFLPRLPETLDELDLLLLTVAKTRRVQQDGIRFQGLRYSDLTLAAYIGEDVTIRYDPRDMAELRVITSTVLCVGRSVRISLVTRSRSKTSCRRETNGGGNSALDSINVPPSSNGYWPSISRRHRSQQRYPIHHE